MMLGMYIYVRKKEKGHLILNFDIVSKVNSLLIQFITSKQICFVNYLLLLKTFQKLPDEFRPPEFRKEKLSAKEKKKENLRF